MRIVFLKNIFSLFGNKKKSEVTIIIAAYGRADALNNTLKTVYKQTYKNWRVLIVADHCDDGFLKQVDTSHPKVKLINLPVRVGHQSGPNSVGIELTENKFLAFLNHDDFWLEDHLEIAVSKLESEKSEIFLGKSAFCHHKNQLLASKQKNEWCFQK